MTWRWYVAVAGCLATVYGAWFVAVPPYGEFPLNDDWAYAHSVRHLLATGQLRISEWAAATVVLPITWGAAVAKLSGGFSFTALRWSTLFFSFVSCLALYDLLCQLAIPRRSALLGALTLTVNPIFVYLSYTFMSDVSYLALMTLSLSCYVRGIARGSTGALLVGSILAALSYLSRQLGVALPLGVALFLIIRDRRLDWRALLVVGLIPFATFVAHWVWLVYFHGVPWGFSLNAVQNSLKVILRPDILWMMLERLLNGFLYVGLFALPVFLAQCASFGRGRLPSMRLQRLYAAWLLIFAAYAVAKLSISDQHMPYLTNVINHAGLGPQLMAGSKPPITPGWVFWLVTIAAPFAGAAQASLWTDRLLDFRRGSAQLGGLLLATAVFMAGFMSLNSYLWDEYLIVFIPVALYLLLALGPPRARGWAVGVCVGLAMLGYSLFEMGDHMAWNAARWKAGERLVDGGIRPESIQGGFEWVGWHDFEAAHPKALAAGRGDDLWAWFHVTPKFFVLAFEPVAGLPVVDQVEYRSRLSSRSGYIYVLKREGAPDGPSPTSGS